MSFDTHQLRYAIAAADHGSLHRAVRALDVEQSMLSRKIQRLEHSIGVKLFVRSRVGVKLTTAGLQFLPRARQLVASADELVDVMRRSGQGSAGGLTLGHQGPVSAGNFRATLLDWRLANPQVELEGVEATRMELLAGIDADTIDLAVMSGQANYHGLRRMSLWSEPILVALPASHILAEHGSVRWTDLCGETFLLSAGDLGLELRDVVVARLSKFGFSPTIKMRRLSREWIMSIIGAGVGITITCGGAAGAQYPDVVLREVHGSHGQALIGYSGYWRGTSDNPALKRFLAFVRSRYALAFEID